MDHQKLSDRRLVSKFCDKSTLLNGSTRSGVPGWGSEKMCTGVEGRFDSEDEDDADRAELESAEHKRNGGDKCRDHVC